MKETIRAAVLTVSDRCSRGESADKSGPAVAAMLTERLGAEVVERECVPDEIGRIEAALRRWAEPGRRIDLALTTGGTGLSPRDVTPEAAMRVIDRPHAGLMELARLRCACAPAGGGVASSPRRACDPRAFLSRGVAGTAGRTLIITLPGSPQGATETLAALLDVLPHATAVLRGEGH